MNKFPNTMLPLVLRTDFADDAMWETIIEPIRNPPGGEPCAHILEDKSYAKMALSEISNLIPDGYKQSFIVIVDSKAIADKDHAVLLVDLAIDPGSAFRAIPSTVNEIQANLFIGNMGFDEYADGADETGVFRGI